MKHVRQQKELIISVALERVDRATKQVGPAINCRRIEVLATNAPEALKYVSAIRKAIALEQVKPDDVNAGVFETRDEEEILRIAASYLSAPAQAIANRKSYERPDLTSTTSEHVGAQSRSYAFEVAPTLGELAWGAYSYGKSLCQHQVQPALVPTNSSQRDRRLKQLGLPDLAIIECAIRYQEREFDVGFIKHLSADGAEIIHKVAMVLACDFSQRIDTAIGTAAAVLIDPIIGGDADLCLCVLRSRRLPLHWGPKYGLKDDSPNR